MLFKNLLGFVAIVAANPLDMAKYTKVFDTRDASYGVSNEVFDNMKFYAQHAAAAYCNYDSPPGQMIECTNDACPLVTQNKATIVDSMVGMITGIGAYVAVDKVRKETVLSIRGSSNIRNWITNVVVLFRNCSFTTDCKVHAGFATAWDEIASEATTAIRDAHKKNPNYKIVLTGHSLGGAVATIAAATLRNAGIPLELYTYGSPRVGNDRFATWFSKQKGGHWRVTHGNDAVPRVPLISFGYRHTTPEYWLPAFWFYPWRTDYTAGEVQVCHGIANNQCNARNTLIHSIVAHLHYLGSTASCINPIIGVRDASETEELSQEVQDQLIKWALEDEKYLKEHDL